MGGRERTRRPQVAAAMPKRWRDIAALPHAIITTPPARMSLTPIIGMFIPTEFIELESADHKTSPVVAITGRATKVKVSLWASVNARREP